MDLARLFLDDLQRAVEHLDALKHPYPSGMRQSKPFHH
jgi:hypothetical protein